MPDHATLSRSDARHPYQQGRGIAALEDYALDEHGTDEAADAMTKANALRARINAAGGWTDEHQAGYDDATRDYALERAGR
jgi:hypothetical protein